MRRRAAAPLGIFSALGGHFLDAGTSLFRAWGTRPRKHVSGGRDGNIVREPVRHNCRRPTFARSPWGPVKQMQHEPGCQCDSQPSVQAEAQDVDDIWQPAVAIAGAVRSPSLGFPPPLPWTRRAARLTCAASCADPAWTGRRATSSRTGAQVRVGPARLDRSRRRRAAEGRVVGCERREKTHPDTWPRWPTVRR